jgi:hypothetical protein
LRTEVAVPGGALKGAALLLKLGAMSSRESAHIVVQCIAGVDILFVRVEELASASSVSTSITRGTTGVSALLPRIIAVLETKDPPVQLILILAMCLLQSATDVYNKRTLDHVESSCNFSIKLNRRILVDGLLNKILEEGRHLCDVATANTFEEIQPNRQFCLSLVPQRKEGRSVILKKTWALILETHARS